VKPSEIKNYQDMWKQLIEMYLEDERWYEIMVTPFDNEIIRLKDIQLPLRLFDTLFLPMIDRQL